MKIYWFSLIFYSLWFCFDLFNTAFFSCEKFFLAENVKFFWTKFNEFLMEGLLRNCWKYRGFFREESKWWNFWREICFQHSIHNFWSPPDKQSIIFQQSRAKKKVYDNIRITFHFSNHYRKTFPFYFLILFFISNL